MNERRDVIAFDTVVVDTALAKLPSAETDHNRLPEKRPVEQRPEELVGILRRRSFDAH